MKWVTCDYSKKDVMRAGEQLISESVTDQELSTAMDVLSSWRAAHAYPMHALLIFLRTQSSKIDANTIVVQRLKRTPSILDKLSRFPQMKLHRMQDISGCRAVVNNVNMVEKLSDSITNSRTRHKLHKKNDYIQNPKLSGYRGIHLVYKYKGGKKAYSDYFVEIQLRSKIQHAWATSVEIVDIFTRQALKASHGSKEWLDFFMYASAEFAKLEKRPIGNHLDGIDTKLHLKKLADSLSVVNRLNAFAVSTQYVATKQDNRTDYFLLELTDTAQAIMVTQYTSADLDKATKAYLEKEKAAKNDSTYDVVLVAAGSMHALKAAYPNYFADSKAFLNYLAKVLS
ncbi:RelA/SpoT domain-containing protein [Geobacter sulfurreducens]|uniref:RelA/SpoT domain-containing protein n=1 Tax=Geobacter sulfurreducens TaxID=35554 RepID=UPI0001E3426C|nr:RelA/SpoT domain-containing protein [Geobacter sulfurreducens]ADN78380.1 RelA/SpoT domain protein [Geobacter sulfurreducens KN400]